MLCEADVPLEQAYKFVGHADKKMIDDIYFHIKPKMLMTAKDLIDKRMNEQA